MSRPFSLRSAALAAAVALLPALAWAQPLVTPAELSARLAQPQLRVIDIRSGGAVGKTPFDVGHIAGALAAPYPKWRGPKENPGALPSDTVLTEFVQSLGIDATTPVVVIYEGADATDFGGAARVYWTLKAAGIPKLSILNGGMAAWRAAKLPTTTDVRRVPRSSHVVRIDRSLVATQQEVAAAIGRNDVRLLDARPAPYFHGETRHPAAKLPGTLVSARNVDHAVWFADGSAALLPAADIRRIAQQHGIQTDQPTVSFCNTGHWAATNWFVLSEVLAQRDVKLYPESMVAWSNAGLPMTNVPNRVQQFWLQLKEAAGNL